MNPTRRPRIIRQLTLGLTLLAAASMGRAATYDQIVLEDSPIGYYRFEETTGSTAADASTSTNDGTYNNVTLGVASAADSLGNAAGFVGSSNVRLTDIAAFDMGTGPASFSMWYRTTSDARGDLLTYKGSGGDFGIHSNSQSDPAGYDSSVSIYHGSFRNQVGADKNRWHQMVYVRGDGAGDSSKLYIDGKLASTGTNGSSFNITNDILIGSNHANDPPTLSTTIGFNGSIDEVAIYDSALKAEAVSTQYYAAVGRQYAINFGANEAGGSLGGSDVAGHVAVEQANWNNTSGAAGSAFNLVDDQGDASDVSVTWSASSTNALPGTSTNADQTMMAGYLDNDATTTVTVSGLDGNIATNYGYDVYVYFDGDNGASWRKGTYTIGDVTLDGEDSEGKDFINVTNAFQLPVAGGTGNVAYVERLDYWNSVGNNDEGNFVVFHNVTGDSFTLTAVPGANNSVGRAPINGIQIVGVAIPTPAALPAGLALLVLTTMRRQRN